jgi:membrane associated rhomboid family serine protease
MIFPFRDDVPAQRTPIVTYAIIAINVAALIWMSRLPPLEQNVAAYEHGFIPLRIAQLTNPQAFALRVAVPARPGFPPQVMPVVLKPDRGQIYLTLVTAMFLHGGWIHLIGNMWFLWIFGDNVEDRLGHFGFAVLYLVGGILASLCHWFMQPDSTLPVIGASGAVAAVLGAYTITWPFARVHSFVFLVIFFTVLDLPALVVLGFWFIQQLVAARAIENRLATQGVAWWAHVGGFLAGMALMQVLSFGAPATHPEGHEEFDAEEDEQQVY